MKANPDVSYDILIALRKIIRAIELHSKKLERTYGLTVPQLLLLKEIGNGREVSASRLAEAMSMSKATVTTIIDRMEAHGFVHRKRSKSDKRFVFVQATDKALKILEENPSILQENFVKKLEALEAWEKTLILSSIQRISAMMKADQIEAHPVLASGPVHDNAH